MIAGRKALRGKAFRLLGEARPTAASSPACPIVNLGVAIQLAFPHEPDRERVTFKRIAAVFGGLFLAFSATSALAAGAEAAPDAAAARPAVKELRPLGDVESEIKEAARLYGLDPALVRAVAQQESGLRQEARSRRGALGVMQLMPQTARELGYDAEDLRGNIRAGAAYLSMMMETFGGDVKRALAAYNAGPGAVQRHGGIPPFAETRNYVTSIMGKMAVNAAGALGQPISATVAQLGQQAVQGAAQAVAQVAGQAASPLAAGVGNPLTDMDRLVARVTGRD